MTLQQIARLRIREKKLIQVYRYGGQKLQSLYRPIMPFPSPVFFVYRLALIFENINQGIDDRIEPGPDHFPCRVPLSLPKKLQVKMRGRFGMPSHPAIVNMVGGVLMWRKIAVSHIDDDHYFPSRN